jgi:hypothetical protein
MASRARRVNDAIGDLHCADIGGKANIKRASLKRADPWGAPARKAPIATHRT